MRHMMLLWVLLLNRMWFNHIPLSSYKDLGKVNKKVNDTERMIRECKESNKRMLKIISEQFA